MKHAQSPQPPTLRRARPEDAPACGAICFEAFRTINAHYGFPPDFPAVEAAVGALTSMFSHPGFWCVVAEQDGRVIGSNCLDERSEVFGVGPITIDPDIQNQGVGRRLMQAVLDRGRERNTPSIRLLQSTFHSRSLSLYAKLGFEARELLSVMQGPPIGSRFEGLSVRPAHPRDLDAANRVSRAVHGHTRSGELSDAIARGTALVVERQGRITAYASALAYFAHAVAETTLDLQALIASAESFGGAGIIVPTRNAELFRWCLENGLRVVQPLTLMTTGLYSQPAGAWLPSILY
jgi:predicted N-acetyltransferase YhbS